MSKHPADVLAQTARDNPDCQVVMGLVWYEEEDYAECRRMFSDSKSLPRTFDEWLAKVLQVERDVLAQGITSVRVVIRPKPFRSWCRKHGFKKLDSTARSEYASWGAKERLAVESRLQGEKASG